MARARHATIVSFTSTIALVFQIAQGAAEERHLLPEIVVGGVAPSAPASERCVEVEIGSSRAFDCLNQKLKREVDRANPNQSPSFNLPPVDARSPDTKTGVVNIPGVQQQYGKNFGVSAVPYRPAPLTFGSPITPRR